MWRLALADRKGKNVRRLLQGLMPAQRTTVEKPRLLFIDNLRILLIALVIMLHLSVTYGGAGSWYYKEGRPDAISFVVLSWHNGASQAFFMGFLFMISGYFTPASYDRKGPRRFLIDRLLRFGIPLLCYDFIINPALVYLLIRADVIKVEGSFSQLLVRYFKEPHVGTGPLWFVEALLIFAVLYILWRVVTGPERNRSRSDRRLPNNKEIAMFALILGAVTFAVRIWLPIGWAFEPLNLQFPFFPQYICFFIIGIIAYRGDWFTRIPKAASRFWLSIAVIFIVVLFPVLFVLGGAPTGNVSQFAGGAHWQCLAYSVWEQFVGVAMIVALLVLFRERLNHQGAVAKAASASTYTAYIIHAPVIVLLALALRNVRLYPLLKFSLVAAVAAPICFALGNFIRKLPPARRIL
jgi:surface polysaccharide O-acyltransferase-like enzyme